MKHLKSIRLRAQKHWVITCLLMVIFVYALERLALYFIKSSDGFDVETFKEYANGIWILDAIVIGLLARFIFKKPKETEDRDRSQEPTRH